MRQQKLLRLSILALGIACAFPAGAQQSSSTQDSSQQSAASGQSAPEERKDNNWGWLGLLGLIGLAGLRRRDTGRYEATRRPA